MSLTIERQREAGEEVIQAALAWWENLRPVGWGLRQHLDNPTINTMSKSECELAKRVANAVEVGRV